MSEAFKVTVTVIIEKSAHDWTRAAEQISYNQQFEIPATGFTEVAKIMGNLDKAIGSIERYNPTGDN